MSVVSTPHHTPRPANHRHQTQYYPQYPVQSLPHVPPQQPLPPPLPKEPENASKASIRTLSYAQQQLGVSLTEGRMKAHAQCKANVERLAAHCRAKNRKFRDVEFDLENDGQRCLHNLMDNGIFRTSDVRRVTEIFDKPVFYSGTERSAEIIQGAVEDCYLVSALSGMTSMDHLIQTLCVARDEEVGIYGFIFYRDCYWIPVIIDDLLFTRVPKYEQLSATEKELYHFDKEKYNATARKGGDSLYFSRPVRAVGQQKPDEDEDDLDDKEDTLKEDGETWIPLVEKAYAKLHGDYASTMYGRTCDALEDMTGGVASLILSKDILDQERFWNEELLKANEDRLFGCWFRSLDGLRSGIKNAAVNGLVGNLSHSVVRAVEIRGKRFVVIRDPWGEAGWDGPWSDGSKQWTQEWLEILPELGHNFGGNGQFVMEYKDFLSVWQEIQRTLIFDESWVMSSQWLHVSQPFPPTNAFSYGDISFTFTLPAASPATIVLSKYNTRYFKDIQGPSVWNLDFLVTKEGQAEPIAESSYSFFYTRSVNVELNLDAGTYIVLARLDQTPVRDKDYFRRGLSSGWDRRKLARIMTQRAEGQAIAANYKPNPQHLPVDVSTLLTGDRANATKATTSAIQNYAGDVKAGESVTVATTTTTTTVITKAAPRQADPLQHQRRIDRGISAGPPPPPPLNGFGYMPYNLPPVEPGWAGMPPSPSVSPVHSPPPSPRPGSNQYQTRPPPPLPPMPLSPMMYPVGSDVLEDDNSIVIGLKVYTKKNAPTVITGQLKAQMD